MAVCEAARNLACTGARPLAITNCLNFGNPEKPGVYWQMDQAIKGMALAARVLKTPVVSGNVSLYNETRGGEAVFPTPVVGMVGLLPDVTRRMDMTCKDEGDRVLLFGENRDDIGGSEYLALVHGIEAGVLPQTDPEKELRLIELLLVLNEKGWLKSCHDISEGGLAGCLAESCITGGRGAEVDLTDFSGRPDGLIFGEAPARVVATADEANLSLIREKADEIGVGVTVIGQVTGKSLRITYRGQILIDENVNDLAAIWQGAIKCAMS